MSKNKNSLKVSKKYLFLGVLCLVVATIILNFFIRHKNNSTSTKSDTKPERGAIINLNGPTANEQKSGDTAKDKALQKEMSRNQPSTPTASGKSSVTPVVTYAGQYDQQVEVGAYVGSVFEDGGTCKLVLSKGSLTQSTQVTAVKGASSVDCPVMTISRSSLEAGSWQATVTYTSSSSEGSSALRSVEVK